MWWFLASVRASLRFHDYKPQPVTFGGVNRWIKQFEKRDRKNAAGLLDKVVYISESHTQRILVEQNAALMKRLADAGLPPKRLIYVQVDDAGSSSPVMLNMLRDAARLERAGCRFVDSRDSLGLNRATNEVGEGALIYTDDFVGTGNQFCKARDFALRSVVGTFSEFLLVPSICEEAIYQLAERGIEAFAGHVHSKAERPLHDNSTILDAETKERFRLICMGISPKMSLGYKEMATMVVLYRNAPNSVPALLRGSQNQVPFAGIFPRTTDMPVTKAR
ncbi:MAG: hypothetical protein WB579_17325 [Bryobacteraceae bacterium]